MGHHNLVNSPLVRSRALRRPAEVRAIAVRRGLPEAPVDARSAAPGRCAVRRWGGGSTKKTARTPRGEIRAVYALATRSRRI